MKRSILKSSTLCAKRLRGINLGGWLLMEGYMLGGRNIPEHVFKSKLQTTNVQEFTKRFRENFITETDFDRIRKLSFNCVRLPFNYRLLEEVNGLDYLKRVVKQIVEQQLLVILDMHALPGAQNPDWHADSDGRAHFWEEERYRQQYFALWEKLAQTFKDEAGVAGYDIMNEAVIDNEQLLRETYQKTIKVIRETGDEHIIFLEGNKWGQQVDCLAGIEGQNLVLSVHFYEPIEFSFNRQPGTCYPGMIAGLKWDKKEIKRRLAKYAQFAEKQNWPVYVGEFGVASRCSCCGAEFRWVDDVLSVFDELKFHWTYWTYKSVRGMEVPDGLYQLSDTSGIVGTRTHCSGMENFYSVLKTRPDEFYRLWQTDNFTLNQFLLKTLKKHLR